MLYGVNRESGYPISSPFRKPLQTECKFNCRFGIIISRLRARIYMQYALRITRVIAIPIAIFTTRNATIQVHSNGYILHFDAKTVLKYRRVYIPGGTFFLTLVIYNREPLFAKTQNISLLRSILAVVKSEMDFGKVGAVILSDHIHFLWMLPSGDTDYSKRVGRLRCSLRAVY